MQLLIQELQRLTGKVPAGGHGEDIAPLQPLQALDEVPEDGGGFEIDDRKDQADHTGLAADLLLRERAHHGPQPRADAPGNIPRATESELPVPVK